MPTAESPKQLSESLGTANRHDDSEEHLNETGRSAVVISTRGPSYSFTPASTRSPPTSTGEAQEPRYRGATEARIPPPAGRAALARREDTAPQTAVRSADADSLTPNCHSHTAPPITLTAAVRL